jgi:hypothetical protein
VALEELGMRLCEASIMHHDGYGQPLNTLDLAQTNTVPFIVPSQKKLLPSLLHVLARRALIAAIVTGCDAESIEAMTRTFRQAL